MTSTPRRSKITPEREQEFYETTLDLIRESGYEALTMEGIAARSHCGKSTLYRQWGAKPQLVAAALRGTRGVPLSAIDTGTLADDLLAVVRANGAHTPRDTALMQELGRAAKTHPDLLCALRETLIEPAVAAIDAMVARAVARGEVAAGCHAAEFVGVQLIGVLRARPMLTGVPADEAYMTRFLNASVLPALGASPVPAREHVG
jgi:AcrR family transcriptional regulator